MARVDYERMAAVYDAARDRTLDQRQPWREALAGYLPPRCGHAVLDLGAGSGQWSGAFTAWYGTPVVAVEPSAGMRAAASAKRLDQVRVVGGRAEAIPLRAGAVAAAWLSAVIHHFDDLDRCARELHRVLCGQGRVLVRGAFPNAPDLVDVVLLRWFPGAARVLATYPSLGDTVAAFTRGGFALEAARGVVDLATTSLREACERVRLRADTLLRLLPDDEFEEGLRRMEAEAAAEAGRDDEDPPGPVFGRLALLVFAKQTPAARAEPSERDEEPA